MRLIKLFVMVSAGFGLFSATVMAHHSTAGIYQEDQNVEIRGVVTEWRFINPHPKLIIAVEAPDGSVNEWDISFGGPAVVHLTSRGYSNDTFTPGETIVVRGRPARLEGVYGILLGRENPTRGDGSSLF